jgi:hypothetical protein
MSRRKHRRVAVCGSRSFPLTTEVAAQVVELLRSYPAGTVFLTRGSAGFDEFVLAVCGLLELPCEALPSAGGSANWDRDVAMVRAADEVVVFLDPDTLTDENTGTAHVLAKALDQRKKAMAYSASGDRLVYVGSSDYEGVAG